MLSNHKKKIRKKIIFESCIVLFISLTPLFFILYDFFPKNDSDTTVTFIGNNGFENVSTYILHLTSKIIPLVLLTLWFFTSKDWWYHIILIPIAMYAFQIFDLMYSGDLFINTNHILWLVPVFLIVIPVVYLIRLKLYDKYINGIDLELMEEELNALKEKRAAKDPEKAFKIAAKSSKLKQKIPLTILERIDRGLSTDNLENLFKKFQYTIKNLI